MPTDIQAAVCRTVGEPLEIECVELDDPVPDEVRVGVVGSGLCHSDLHVIDGSLPASLPVILGHEVAGVVLEVGSQIQGLEVGDHVVAGISAHCDSCQCCAAGKTWLCERRLSPGLRSENQPKIRAGDATIGGIGGLSGFAEQMVLHRSAAVQVDPGMPLDLAALIGCAVVTGVGTVIMLRGSVPARPVL